MPVDRHAHTPQVRSRPWRTRVRLGAAVAAALVVGAVAVRAAALAPRVARERGLYRVSQGARVYEFDTVWRTESLWADVPGPGAHARVEGAGADLLAMRDALLRHLDVDRLDDIPTEHGDGVAALRTLGYL